MELFLLANRPNWFDAGRQGGFTARETLEQILADSEAMAHVDQIKVIDSHDPRQGQRWLQDHGFGEIL